MDLLVKLYDLDYDFKEKRLKENNIEVKKASIIDKNKILTFVAENFDNESAWVSECEYALFNNPPSCYIAVENKQIIGFACYDATAKGFFGPTGVRADFRGKGVGAALLFRSLYSMKEAGYAYAVIGWIADSARDFYIKQTGAVEIPDSPPEKSIYKNLTAFSE